MFRSLSERLSSPKLISKYSLAVALLLLVSR
jgi:hypothetical protein